MKHSIKLIATVALIMAGVATAYAFTNTDRENSFIQLGNIEGQQLQLHKANLAIDEQIAELEAQKLSNSTMWQTMESERVALHDSLFSVN